MTRSRVLALAALILALCCLTGCDLYIGPGPQVTSVSKGQGLQMVKEFCGDLAKVDNQTALQRMASRTYRFDLSTDDVSAIVEYAQFSHCPDEFR